MLIFPAIDIFEGKCVRLRQGDYAAQTVYSGSPKEVAQSFLDAGLFRLHVVDLEGAKAGAVKNWRALESILSIHGVTVQVGGGVRKEEDVRRLLTIGVSRVIVGSVAVTSPSLVGEWLKTFGAERVAIALDIKEGQVAFGGWLKADGLSPHEFIDSMMKLGARTFICTDVERDGMLRGPNLPLYKQLTEAFPRLDFTASGGVSGVDDIRKLRHTKVRAVIVGKAIYEGRISLQELKQFEH